MRSMDDINTASVLHTLDTAIGRMLCTPQSSACTGGRHIPGSGRVIPKSYKGNV